MSDLKIEQVTITDNISERAKTCKVILAPEGMVPAPVAEFAYPGDVTQLTGTNIRPTGTVINVNASFGGVPSHTVFSGAIEIMDDLTDPNRYNYTIILSNTPANQKHRTKITKVYNQQTAQNSPADSTTIHSIIEDCCRIAGIPFGRCDLPNLKVWGTYEVIRKNPGEVAEEFCSAFNIFEYLHYFVRIDETNGLSIIGIDYTKGGEVTNAYALQNLEACNRSYERYMPENRLGDGNIILVGCDVYGADPNSTTVENTSPGNSLTDHDVTPPDRTDFLTCTKTYSQDSRNSQELGMDQWSTVDTTIQFTVQVTMEPVWEPLMEGDIDAGHWTYASMPVGDLDSLITALANNQVKSVSVIESNVIRTHEEQWSGAGAADPSSGASLAQTVDTTITYEQKRWPRHIYKANDFIAGVPTMEQTITSIYPLSSQYEQTLLKRFYNYSDTGVHIGTVTKLYHNYNGGWTLQNVSTTTENSPSLTSAALQYAADQQAELQEQLDAQQKSGANRTETYNIPLSGLSDNKSPTAKQNKSFSVIGKHKLINGIPQPVTNIPSRTSQTIYTEQYGGALQSSPQKAMNLPAWVTSLGLTDVIRKYRQLPGNTLVDPNAAQFEQEQAERNAFHISVGWMDMDGLKFLWGMCLRQRALERRTPYWDKVLATCSIDTSPAAGESLVVRGSGGICDSVEHILTESDAITTVAVKRLIV